jgi:hypothetical protein
MISQSQMQTPSVDLLLKTNVSIVVALVMPIDEKTRRNWALALGMEMI